MKKMHRKYSLLVIVLIVMAIVVIVSINELNKTKIATLNIENVKMVVSNADFEDGTTSYGLDIYLDTRAYELDSDNYYIKVILPENDSLDEYIIEGKRNIPQKVSPRGSFNIASALLDDLGYLRNCIGNKYEITLELYKGDIRQDSKIYEVLCESGINLNVIIVCS